MNPLRKLWRRIFPSYRRLELRFVNYSEGDRLIRESAGCPEYDRWQIAREEDKNTMYGMVFLERRERIL